MLTFFRSFFKSKIGLGLTFAFLGLIAFAFASADVSSTGMFGGVAGGNRVAVVGDERIDSAELSRSTSNALDRVRQEDPTISMPEFIAQGGFDEVLSQLIDRYVISAFARDNGLRAGDNLINSEIRTIGAFRGADGNFSETAYRQALAAQGLTDAQVRNDIRSGLLAQQIAGPSAFGAVMPQALARRYAGLFRERREGAIGFLPSAAFAPEGVPSSEQLQAFYEANRADFIRPERRIVRYATFDNDAIADEIEPTENEIAARYQQDRAQYAASETRSYTQLIVPTQQAANALRERVQGGASLDAVAREAGFSTVQQEAVTRAEVASDASSAVADAIFSAARGSIAVPARSALGWHVVRVDAVNSTPARPLAQVRGEIADTVREEKRTRALANVAAEIEERIDEGATLADVARERGIAVETTQPLTANGQVYGTDETAPEILGPALATAFQMEESEPQVAEIERGETYLVFEVTRITGAATPPLAEIRDQVTAAWRLTQGSQAARAAADRVIKRLREGTSLAAALQAEDVALPAVENINLTREDLARQQDRRIPPPLALMFSMAQGTAKKLAAARDLGWFVVDLEEISVGTMEADDPLIGQAREQLASTLGQEYTEQLVAAMRGEVGIERNEDAIDAVRRQLVGERQ
ncbi:SurA N-terminal domain-containing protein [Erythrobacter sp. A6_0]|uniref:peptidyl-prolyl cis-trans isomerase n=1 Tax=Erythrobacter sp. A6_0 TaxID=2821089 RepID=UPI001ADA0C32|nr:SurA N-terminal domain-containing protein [Erythrobacter sp. A6_0]MBO9510521.1 SurA N-terminal domain-containing protein [Erythrobacter sp. A6_0]